jgi:hypothetical protein
MALTVHLTVVVDGLGQDDAPAFIQHVGNLYNGQPIWLPDSDADATIVSVTALTLPLVATATEEPLDVSATA